MTLVSVSLEERTGRVETQLLELEHRRTIRKLFFPFHLKIIEAAARASVHAALPLIDRDSSDESAYESQDGKDSAQDEALPSPVGMPEEHLGYIDTLFQLFDTNQDGYWDMTETNRWMSVMAGQNFYLQDWELTCESAQCDPMKGLDHEAVRQWYRTSDRVEQHFYTILDANGEPDARHAELSEGDLHRLDTMLEVIFREFDAQDTGVWNASCGEAWLEALGWYDTWEECCEAVQAAGLTLEKKHVAMLYGANEYLLSRHYATLAKQRHEDNTFNAEDDEDEEGYCVGGYHRVDLGDVYNGRYEVIRKLGWGNFSTVWLAKDQKDGPPVALKIGKGATLYREMSEQEVDVLQRANAHITKLECDLLRACSKRLVRMMDFFSIEGPNGRHPTMALEAVGPDILKLLTAHDFAGVAPCIVKTLIKNMLEGLAFLHDMGLAHADIKPENVLIQTIRKDGTCDQEYVQKLLAGTLERPEGMSLEEFMGMHYSCKVSDFGSSKWVAEDKTVHQMQTLEYRAPEVVLGYSPDVGIDVWSVACTCYELLTGCFLFNPKACEGPLPQDAQHVALFMETVGPIPDAMVFGGGLHCHNYFDEYGRFVHGKVQAVDLEDSIVSKYGTPTDQAHGLVEFLLPMLQLSSNNRVSAKEAMQHPWLNVVDGDDQTFTRRTQEWVEESEEAEEAEEAPEEDDEPCAEKVVVRSVEAAAEAAPHQAAAPAAADAADAPARAEAPAAAAAAPAAAAAAAADTAPTSSAPSQATSKAFIMLDLRHRADYADLRREELVDRRRLRTTFFPMHLEAIKESARARA